ncbi:MAG: aminotransferase class V-fold PLP-dependent enzyme, partial [Bacilli bacterium]
MSTAALDALRQTEQTYWGNNQSLHEAGLQASGLLRYSQQFFADDFHTFADAIVSTSGGTESNRLAIDTWLGESEVREPNVVWSSLNHASVPYALRFVGRHVSLRPVGATWDGTTDEDTFIRTIDERTAVVCLPHVNSEMGRIVATPSLLARIRTLHPYVRIHVYAVQSYLKYDVASL